MTDGAPNSGDLLGRLTSVLDARAAYVGAEIEERVTAVAAEPDALAASPSLMAALRELVATATAVMRGGGQMAQVDRDVLAHAGEEAAAAGVAWDVVAEATHEAVGVVGELAERTLFSVVGPAPGDPAAAVVRRIVTQSLISVQHELHRGLRAGFDRHGEDVADRRAVAREVALRHLLLEGDEHPDLPGFLDGDTAPLDLTAPLAVVVLAYPHAAPNRAMWYAVEDVVAGLSSSVHGPVSDTVAQDRPEVAVLIVPAVTDAAGLRGELAAGCSDTGLMAVYGMASAPARVEQAYALIRGAFMAAGQARRFLGPAMSVDELVPYQAAAAIPPAAMYLAIQAKMGPVLDPEAADWMFPTARAVVEAGRWTFEDLAPRLGIKRRALSDRIAKLSEVLGIDFAARVEGYVEIPFALRFAFHLYEVNEEWLPPPGDARWRDAEADDVA